MSSSENFEERIERACKDQEIPGLIAIATDVEGKFEYKKAFGQRSLKDLSKNDPMPLDATMWLASCSKLATSVAVMQLVEQGKLSLEDDVTQYLPELKGLQILKGYEEGTDEPILIENTKPILLKHLLTHQSGLPYIAMNPPAAKYRMVTDGYTPTLAPTVDFDTYFKSPLIFAPGEAWEYSPGVDWAGKIVERISGLTLEEYWKRNIWTPLGVTSITFYLNKNAATAEKLVDMSVRTGGFTKMGFALDPNAMVEYTDESAWNKDAEFCAGGGGGYGAPLDYQKLLHSLAAGDEKVLKNSTVDLMFQDYLTPEAKASLDIKLTIPEVRAAFGLKDRLNTTYGIGGMIYLEASKGGRSVGTMNWGGYPNLLWFCDRKAGLSGILGTQILPMGDMKFLELMGLWERELYEKSGKA